MMRGGPILALLVLTTFLAGCLGAIDGPIRPQTAVGTVENQVPARGLSGTGEASQEDGPASTEVEEEYRVEYYDWTGFISCGFVVVAWAGDACSNVDPAADRTRSFELDAGAETVTAVLIWDSQGLLGDELQYGLARDPCSGSSCSTPTDYYGYTEGTSPLELRVDVGGVDAPADVQLRVFPPFNSGVNVFLQQEFTVHYQLHYHEPAPEDFDPKPEM